MNTDSSTEGYRPDQQAVLASDPGLGLRDWDGRTAAHHAVRSRNYETLGRCIERKMPLIIRDDEGRNALAEAVATGWMAGADRLLQVMVPDGAYNPAFRILDYHKGNLLHAAVISGSPHMVEWVLAHDPNPMEAFTHDDRHGCSPLRLLAESPKSAAAKMASALLHRISDLKRGGEAIEGVLNHPDRVSGLTPLGAAVELCDLEMCTVFINWGAKAEDEGVKTPLQLARECLAIAQGGTETTNEWREMVAMLERRSEASAQAMDAPS